jgi:hypothetical protein
MEQHPVVVVTVVPPPCPLEGTWSGYGEHFSIDFDVDRAGESCWVENVTGHLSALCYGDGAMWSMYVEFILPVADIADHQFSTADGETRVSGTFTTLDTVEGTWSYHQVSALCRLPGLVPGRCWALKRKGLIQSETEKDGLRMK